MYASMLGGGCGQSCRNLPKVSEDREGGLRRFAYKRLFAEDSPGGERHRVQSLPSGRQPSPGPASGLLQSSFLTMEALGSQPMTLP